MWTATAARRLLPALLLPAAAASLGGCAGAPPREPPPAVERQEDLARKGARAFRADDLARAIELHRGALAAARATEDEERIGARLVDLAALERAAGEPEKARALLAELVTEPPPLPFPAALRADAALLAALLAVDDVDLVGGRALAEAARRLCREARCRDEGRIVNLLARIDFLAGDFDCAVRRAEEALRLLRRAKGSEEPANAHRVIGDVRLAEGNAAAAAAAYAKALALDKRLRAGDKIHLDLLGLGHAAAAAGRAEEAAGWYRRARDVAAAAGDGPGAAAAEALLAPPAPAR